MVAHIASSLLTSCHVFNEIVYILDGLKRCHTVSVVQGYAAQFTQFTVILRSMKWETINESTWNGFTIAYCTGSVYISHPTLITLSVL